MQKLLTIVVPVYKVEQYINKCLDSCIIYKSDGSLDEEKMNQLEVIVVNDGTPDRSAELSREYTVRYPQTFRQIDKKNGGHGSAWNVGLKEATGKYLRFLDSDDWLTNLDKLMEKLAETDADLVLNPKRIVRVDNTIECHNIYDTKNVVKDIMDFDFGTNQDPDIVCFQYATYKKNVLELEKPLFLEHCSYDDTVLIIAPFVKARTYMVLDFYVYNYLIGRIEQSVSPQRKRKSIKQAVMNYQYVCDFWEKNKASSRLEYSQGVKNILAMSANFWLSMVGFLPYALCKDTYKLYAKNVVESSCNIETRQFNRYRKYPFMLFYIMEVIRERILKR